MGMLPRDSDEFVVDRVHHLGLGIVVGRVFSAGYCRRRGNGEFATLQCLGKFFVDPGMFRPVVPPQGSREDCKLSSHESMRRWVAGDKTDLSLSGEPVAEVAASEVDCRYCKYCSCRETLVHARDDDGVITRWVAARGQGIAASQLLRRRSSFSKSLDVLIRQLDRRLSLEVIKKKTKLKTLSKKKGEMTKCDGSEGKNLFVRRRRRQWEMLSGIPGRKHGCDICTYTTLQLGNLRRHKYFCHQQGLPCPCWLKRYFCDMCNYSIRFTSDLGRHKKAKH